MGSHRHRVAVCRLWLGELVPALLAGTTPASLTEAGLWVNPIHVIDLSMVLPAFVVTGVAALTGRPHGLFWLGPWLVFSVLMGSSIIAAMVLMMLAGAPDTLVPTVMVSVVVAASILAVRSYLAPPARTPRLTDVTASSPEEVHERREPTSDGRSMRQSP